MINEYVTRYNVERLPVLVSERVVEYGNDGDTYNDPREIALFLWCGLHMSEDTEERVVMMCFDGAGHMIGFFEISRGTASYSVFDKSSIARKALLIGASSIVVAHNHPGGSLEPSDADDRANNEIKAMCELIGIKYNDFLIVTYDRKEKCDAYYSYYDEKRL